MSEFSAIANIEARLDQSSLRSVRRELEQGVGDVSVGVNSMRPDGGRPGGGVGRGQRAGILDASRKQLGAVETLVDLAEEQVDLLEDILDRGGVGGGGGGGGGGLGGLLPTGGGAGLGLGTGLGLGGAASGIGLGAAATGAGIVGAGALATIAPWLLFGHAEGEFRTGDLLGGNRGTGPGGTSPMDSTRSTGSGNNIFEALADIGVTKPSWWPSDGTLDLDTRVSGGGFDTPTPGSEDSPFMSSAAYATRTGPYGMGNDPRLDPANWDGDPTMAARVREASQGGGGRGPNMSSAQINQTINVEASGVDERMVERTAEKKAKELRRELEREIQRGGSFGRGIR